jgi:hypothetical protein
MKKIKNKKIIIGAPLFVLLIAFSFGIASLVSGTIVPCGFHNDDPAKTQMCTLCHLIVGIKNLFDYATKIILFVGLVALVAAGIIYIVSSGNEAMMNMAKGFIKNVLTGAAVVLLAWLIVNTIILKFGVNMNIMPSGSWWEFSCNTTSVGYVPPEDTSGDQFHCTGEVPANSDSCLASTHDLTADKPISLVDECPNNPRGTCTYFCLNGYELETNGSGEKYCELDGGQPAGGKCGYKDKGVCYEDTGGIGKSGCDVNNLIAYGGGANCNYSADCCIAEGGGLCGYADKGNCYKDCSAASKINLPGGESCSGGTECCVTEGTNLGSCSGAGGKQGSCFVSSNSFNVSEGCPAASPNYLGLCNASLGYVACCSNN